MKKYGIVFTYRQILFSYVKTLEVKEIYKIDDNSECEKYANNIFSIAYSIGGDYGETTIRAIAETLHKRNNTP